MNDSRAPGSLDPAQAPLRESLSTPAVPARRAPGPILGAVALAVVLIAGALVLVLARGGDSAEARPLALAFTQGESQTYAIHMAMDGQVSSELFGDMPLTIDVTEVVTWTVNSVDDQGTATIEVRVDEMSGTVDGVAIPSAAATPPIEIVIAADGRVVSAGGLALGGAEQTQGFGFPGMGQLTPILPDDGDAVAPGDTWDKHFAQDFPFGDGTIEFTATSTYVRNETVNGREAAVIVTQMSVPMDFTLSFRDMLGALEGELGAQGVTGLDVLADASIAYSGRGDITQTSFVDLGAQELLRTQSTGDFDMTAEFSGVPGLEGDVGFTGTFTQGLELRS